MIQLDIGLGNAFRELSEVAPKARWAEEAGLGAFWVPETKHNPFLPLVLAAEHTERMQLGTAVAIAFPRSPLVLAHTSWDLSQFSGGRFILSLGTQVKGHIERRFSVPWSSPGPRLRDMILAIRAIWSSWQHGEKLDYRGDFYSHTLMTPFFDPGPIEHPDIPIFIGGVNRYMCGLAGEVADGFLMHSLNSVDYIRQLVLPELEKGLAKSGRPRSAMSVRATAFPIVGETDEELEQARATIRDRIAFYASTRTYKAILDLHGWGDLCERLHGMAARSEWKAMGDQITNEMLDTFCVTATYDTLGEKLRARYDGLVDRLVLNQVDQKMVKRLDWAGLARELAA